MSVFEYTALTEKGKKISGILDADTLWAAKNQLRDKGIYPVNIHKIQDQSDKKSNSYIKKFISYFNFYRPRSAELSMITRQLATLLSAGFPLLHALTALIHQTKSNSMVKVLSRVKDNVKEGSSFSASLGKHPRVFSLLYVNMIHAGESSGTLEIVLERLADFTEHSEDTKHKIRSALAYPIFMAIVGFGVLLVLLAYVVPGIVNVFSDMNQSLPLATIFLIKVSKFFKIFWWVILLIPLVTIWGLTLLRKHSEAGLFIDRIFICLPFIGPLIQKNNVARFARTLGSLMENGIPMLAGLEITRTIVENKAMSDLLDRASKRVEQGGQLNELLNNDPYFPYLAAQMIQIGENSGEMEKMLEKIADIYEKEVQTAVVTATSLIEPVIIVFMGLIAGAIIMAICLPIFDMNQLIR